MPQTFDEAVAFVKNSQSKEECVRKAYMLVTSKFRGYRIRTYTHLFKILNSDPNDLWNRSGFLHCTQMNTLMKELLLQGGLFAKQDIQKKWTQIWLLSPHQFLKVNVGGTWFDIDAWSKVYGIPFGDHAHSFHSGKIKAI